MCDKFFRAGVRIQQTSLNRILTKHFFSDTNCSRHKRMTLMKARKVLIRILIFFVATFILINLESPLSLPLIHIHVTFVLVEDLVHRSLKRFVVYDRRILGEKVLHAMIILTYPYKPKLHLTKVQSLLRWHLHAFESIKLFNALLSACLMDGLGRKVSSFRMLDGFLSNWKNLCIMSNFPVHCL